MAGPYHPVHSSIENRLNPQFRDYYNETFARRARVCDVPIELIRAAPKARWPGSADPLPTGKTEDILVTPASGPAKGVQIPIRAHTPPGDAPSGGWPAMVYYHGGGWVLGDIDSEEHLITSMCARAKCVAIAVQYRLAPENPFPAAVDDAWEVLLWATTAGKDKLDLNLNKVAVGGSSAGANLAAVVTQRAATQGSPRLCTQLLTIPTLDQTRTVETSACWREMQHTVSLPADTMNWFRDCYLPNKADWSDAAASPLLWQGDWSGLPPAIITLAGLDILRSDGDDYAKKLADAGVNVQNTCYEDQPHIFIAACAAIEDGQRAVNGICASLHDAFYKRDSIFAKSNI